MSNRNKSNQDYTRDIMVFRFVECYTVLGLLGNNFDTNSLGVQDAVFSVSFKNKTEDGQDTSACKIGRGYINH